jgi:hypothetical protein
MIVQYIDLASSHAPGLSTFSMTRPEVVRRESHRYEQVLPDRNYYFAQRRLFKYH